MSVRLAALPGARINVSYRDLVGFGPASEVVAEELGTLAGRLAGLRVTWIARRCGSLYRSATRSAVPHPDPRHFIAPC